MHSSLQEVSERVSTCALACEWVVRGSACASRALAARTSTSLPSLWPHGASHSHARTHTAHTSTHSPHTHPTHIPHTTRAHTRTQTYTPQPLTHTRTHSLTHSHESHTPDKHIAHKCAQQTHMHTRTRTLACTHNRGNCTHVLSLYLAQRPAAPQPHCHTTVRKQTSTHAVNPKSHTK